jgi:hypothetical protein
MAGPVAGYLQMPLDTGNTGKKLRTQSKVVGADTVLEYIFVGGRRAVVLGEYGIALAQQSVQASAQDATATGFLWAHVPAAISNKKARIKKVRLSYTTSSTTVAPTGPVIVARKFTFTGTASGAQVAAGDLLDNGVSAILDLRTAVTGLTVTAGAVFASSSVPAVLTGVGIVGGVDYLLLPVDYEDEFWMIAPGHGICFYQNVAGTASDPRRFSLDLQWDVIDTA